MSGRPSNAKSLAYKEKRWLQQKYTVEKKSIAEITCICGVSTFTVLDYLKKHGIKRRNKRYRKDSKTYDAICCNADCRRAFNARADQHLKYSRCPLCAIRANAIAASYFLSP